MKYPIAVHCKRHLERQTIETPNYSAYSFNKSYGLKNSRSMILILPQKSIL